VGGVPLSGAIPVAVRTTDVNGTLSFYGLLAGDFYLFEVTTPNGYESIKPIRVTFDESVTSYFTLVTINRITNEIEITTPEIPGAELPNTGGPGILSFTLTGLTLIIVSILILLTYHKKEIKI